MKKLLKLVMIVSLCMTSLFAVKDYQLRAVEKEILKEKLPNCINVKSYYDQVYCSTKVYAILDDVLNQTYRQVRKVLTKDQRNRLRKVQIQWIHNRDKQCANVSNVGVVVNMTCAKKQTLESILYLNAIYNNPQNFDLILDEYAHGR